MDPSPLARQGSSIPQTKDEHLAWAKGRAKEYLDMGDAKNAWGSFASDMMKHPECAKHPALIDLAPMLLMGGLLRTVQQVRDFIEGFN